MHRYRKLTLLFFCLTFSLIAAQNKQNRYINKDYSFSITTENKFEDPEENGFEDLKTFRFLDLNIDVNVQPPMLLDEAKNTFATMKPNSTLKVRSQTFGDNKFIALIEKEDTTLIKIVKILITNKHTYFIHINKPIDFENGIKQLDFFGLEEQLNTK